MASGKKSFVLYADLIHMVRKLPKETSGALFLHILEYVNDLNPVIENDLLLEISFEPIKQQLKRDLQDWEGKKMLRSESGKLGGIKSGESRRNKANKANEANASKALSNEANEAVNATATANVTVNDNGTNKAAAAIGAIKVKEIANNVWKDQLWKEQLSMGLSISVAELKKWMAQFNASVADDTIHDFNDARYKRMIRGWISKQQAKGVTVETGAIKKSDAPSLKRLPT